MNKLKFFIIIILCACICTYAFYFHSHENSSMKSITVATNPNWPPLEMLTSENEVVGYDIDIINAIVEELNFEVNFYVIPWSSIFSTLNSNKSDIIASTVTITEERKKKYLFSNPYYEIKQSIIVSNNSTITKAEDLHGKIIGVQVNTSAINALEKIKMDMGIDIELKIYENIALVFEDLKSGKLDGAICDDPVGRYYANRKEDFSDFMKVAFIIGEIEELGFVFRLSDTQLADDVNKALKTIKENGKEMEIRKKWFGEN